MFIFNTSFPKENSKDYFFAKNFNNAVVEGKSFKYTKVDYIINNKSFYDYSLYKEIKRTKVPTKYLEIRHLLQECFVKENKITELELNNMLNNLSFIKRLFLIEDDKNFLRLFERINQDCDYFIKKYNVEEAILIGKWLYLKAIFFIIELITIQSKHYIFYPEPNYKYKQINYYHVQELGLIDNFIDILELISDQYHVNVIASMTSLYSLDHGHNNGPNDLFPFPIPFFGIMRF